MKVADIFFSQLTTYGKKTKKKPQKGSESHKDPYTIGQALNE